MKNKTLSSANLETLGAKRLADLLMEICRQDPAVKRRISCELAEECGVEALASELSKRLTALQKAKQFLDSKKCRAFVREMDSLRQLIVNKIAHQRPDLALDLLWRFMASAPPAYERTHEGAIDVNEVFRLACIDLGSVAAKADADPVHLADQVFEAIATNRYGEFDPLVGSILPAIEGTGALHLRLKLTRALKHDSQPDPYGKRAGKLKRALQDIADAQEDVDAFIEQESITDREKPHIATAIARRLLAAGRPAEALEALRKGAPKAQRDFVFDRDQQFVYGNPESDEWREEWVDALCANGRVEEAQHFRWDRFEKNLDERSLRAYLDGLPESERARAEQKAVKHALAFPRFTMALQFLTQWQDEAAASTLVLQRRSELAGKIYEVLVPAAEALQKKQPEATVLILRAMVEDILVQGRSAAYGYAARHLLRSLALALEESSGIESHAGFLLRLRANHSRKYGFWSQVGELNPRGPEPT